MATDYAYSLNQENYHGGYRSEGEAMMAAAAAALDESGPSEDRFSVWVGEACHATCDGMVRVDTDRMLEQMQEDAYEHAPEVSESWLQNIKPEHEIHLRNLVKSAIVSWMKMFDYQPKWFMVDQPKEHVLFHANNGVGYVIVG